MNLIELHMLQSFPVNCLNRDLFGSPKSTVFGGVPRARISSQCWKRAIRQAAKEESPMFEGKRSKYFYDQLILRLEECGQSETEAASIAAAIVSATKIKLDKGNIAKSLFYFSPEELKAAVNAYLNCPQPKNKVASAARELGRVTRDGVDIAFFGRMVADTDLTLEGAAMFSHAISVNRVDNDLDFFTAVDDLSPKEKTGSAHMGDLEFNTACYYRYIALNLDLLADDDHLAILTADERKLAVAVFLRSCALAVPAARKNSMLASTVPGFILGIARQGAPLSLANAFEIPVKGESPLSKAREAMLTHWQELKKLYGITADCEAILPEKPLDQIIRELVEYVR